MHIYFGLRYNSLQYNLKIGLDNLTVTLLMTYVLGNTVFFHIEILPYDVYHMKDFQTIFGF